LNIDENYELTTRAYVDRLKQKLADEQKEEMEQIQAEAKKIKEHKKKEQLKAAAQQLALELPSDDSSTSSSIQYNSQKRKAATRKSPRRFSTKIQKPKKATTKLQTLDSDSDSDNTSTSTGTQCNFQKRKAVIRKSPRNFSTTIEEPKKKKSRSNNGEAIETDTNDLENDLKNVKSIWPHATRKSLRLISTKIQNRQNNNDDHEYNQEENSNSTTKDDIENNEEESSNNTTEDDNENYTTSNDDTYSDINEELITGEKLINATSTDWTNEDSITRMFTKLTLKCSMQVLDTTKYPQQDQHYTCDKFKKISSCIEYLLDNNVSDVNRLSEQQMQIFQTQIDQKDTITPNNVYRLLKTHLTDLKIHSDNTTDQSYDVLDLLTTNINNVSNEDNHSQADNHSGI
jgi:hypothetical protein